MFGFQDVGFQDVWFPRCFLNKKGFKYPRCPTTFEKVFLVGFGGPNIFSGFEISRGISDPQQLNSEFLPLKSLHLEPSRIGT